MLEFCKNWGGTPHSTVEIKLANASENSVCKCEDVWGYHGSWLYLYQLEARRRDLMHINWSPQAGVLRESCQISHLDFIRPLNWTGSKTDKLDLLLTSTALSSTHNPVSVIILSTDQKWNQYISCQNLLQILMYGSLTFSQSWQMLNVDGWIVSSPLKCAPLIVVIWMKGSKLLRSAV